MKTPVHPGYDIHGLSNSKIRYIHHNMFNRCNNKNCDKYEYYGGRGITICEEWKDLECFADWCINNGYKEGLQLDRINNDGNYEPNNCRFVTKSKQMRNTRQNVNLEYKGETRCLTEWCEILGLKYSTIYARLFSYNWPVERAFEV